LLATCLTNIKHWMSQNFLLNSDKTEVMVVGSQKQLQRNVGLHEHDPCSLSSNPELSFETHIREVTKLSFYHLRNIAKLGPIISVSDSKTLMHKALNGLAPSYLQELFTPYFPNIVQFNRLPLVISFIASSSANTGLIINLEKDLVLLFEELRQVVEV
ncbi:LTOR3 protein, partial [Polyodon spathula]|nr:LTOR3 protein [Polyodon spathula]